MSSRNDEPPEFFVDRSLGKSIVEGLRAAGLNDWIVLTKDDAIRRRPAERDALIDAAVRVFCLTTAQLRGSEQTERFIRNRRHILRQARRPGPYIYGVYSDGLRRLWPAATQASRMRKSRQRK